ncbi:hypothetical protein RI054_21g92680 [Pseudoscourfieldia marina]
MRPLLLLIVVEILLLHGAVVYAAKCKDGEPCKQVGSSTYPISASASLGALGNVTLSQAGPDEPLSLADHNRLREVLISGGDLNV